MSYDPFVRGPAPVGVRGYEIIDEARDRKVPVEIWYPASDDFRGHDLDPESQDRYNAFEGAPNALQKAVRDATPRDGELPLVAFSHGGFSHRRSGSELCTHLASHGYAVTAVDHMGGTMADMMYDMQNPDASERRTATAMSGELRPGDIRCAVDFIADGGAGALSEQIAAERYGMTGISIGGWTTLALNERDPRIAASMPMVPAFGQTSLGDVSPGELNLGAWPHEIPVLLLAAGWDGIVRIDELHRLYRELAQPKRMLVLCRGGHMHFGDGAAFRHEIMRQQFSQESMKTIGSDADFANAAKEMRPFAEHCPAEHGLDLVRGSGLAFFDDVLRDRTDARDFMKGDLVATFGAREIEVEEY